MGLEKSENDMKKTSKNTKNINNNNILNNYALEDKDNELTLENLNEKHEFAKGLLNYNDIIFSKNSKKICYKTIEFLNHLI